MGCILWDNTDGSIEIDETSSPRVSHSLIEDVTYSLVDGQFEGTEVWPGEGNINQPPLFVSPGVYDFERRTECWLPDFVLEAPDYRLQPGSAAIDAGTLEGTSTVDIDGTERPC